MKRCPTCNKTFTDPSLSYCIDDGTPLAPVDTQEPSTVSPPQFGNELNTNQNANPTENVNTNTNLNINSNSNAALPKNTNAIAKTDENNNSNSSTAPTDNDLVLAQLTNLEHEWTVANINADKKKLATILA